MAKTIIAGSRTFDSLFLLHYAIREARKAGLEDITEVVSGAARGADRLGEDWAEQFGIPVNSHPADWKYHGKKAGILRNKDMADYADQAIILWDGYSPGTKNMIDTMRKLGKRCFVLEVRGYEI
jgi:hypothetical protein